MEEQVMFKWHNHNIKLMARAIPCYLLGRGCVPVPKIVKFDITYRCPLRCKMCFYWNQQTSLETTKVIREKGEELTFSEMQKYLIPQLKAIGLEYINITGGEPFQRKDIYDILSLFGRQKFRVSLNSNLPNVKYEEAKQIIDSNLFSIQLSLHGPRKIHDFISEKEGAFESVTNAIRHLKSCQRETNSENPKLVLCYVVSPYNQNYLFETINIVEELGVNSLFFHLMEWQDENLLANNGKLSRGKMTQKDLLHIDVDALMSQIEKVVRVRKQFRTKIFFHPLDYPFTKDQLKQWYYNPTFTLVKKCFYLWMETRIDPYGWVLPCYYIDQPMGNIKERTFVEIWNCDEYRALRKELANELLPMCHKCCKLSRRWQNLLFHL